MKKILLILFIQLAFNQYVKGQDSGLYYDFTNLSLITPTLSDHGI